MMKRCIGVLFAASLAACGFGNITRSVTDGPSGSDAAIDSPVDAKAYLDAAYMDASGACNVLTQSGCNAGEKCTWLLDALTPTYVGHIGCAPSGTATAGQSCMFGAPGATGYDHCAKGLVCGNYNGGTGICKQICDNQGGNPMCDAQHTCVAYSTLFQPDMTMAAVAGVCDQACDPLNDNDFDGAGTGLTKTGTVCTSAMSGCYGFPSSSGTRTSFVCAGDIHYGMGFFHRVQCTDTNGCAGTGPQYYVNSCNQGYLPFLRESTMVSTVVCIALCKPLNCYAGNCGASDVNRFGASPHRCNATDARGTFNAATNGDECAYIWQFEIDGNNTFHRSPYSDVLGLCYDHSKYQYDSNNNGSIDAADATLPACSQLQVTATGTDPTMPLTFFGAKDFGCVDTATAGVQFTGKPQPPKYHWDIRAPYGTTFPAP